MKSNWCTKARVRSPQWVTLISAALCMGSVLAVEPIVVGMSLTQGIHSDGRAVRVLAGAKAYVERINAAGGIQGQPLAIIELDDHGDPEQHAQNVRTLVKRHRAVAILGCIGDAVCAASAAVANELRVPLIAPLSGSALLARGKNPYVFRIRAEYSQEAELLAAQLAQLGCAKIALLSDGSGSTETDALLRTAMERKGLKVDLIQLSPALTDKGEALLKHLGAGGYHAAAMNIRPQTIDAMVNLGLHTRTEWPRTMVTISSGNLVTLISHFKGPVLGFSQVVPNPDRLSHPLAQALNQDADRFSGSYAVTFEGMEAYLGARLLVDALRRSGRKPTAEGLFQILDTNAHWDINGFRLSFKDQRSGSDWVEIGLRSRDGRFVN